MTERKGRAEKAAETATWFIEGVWAKTSHALNIMIGHTPTGPDIQRAEAALCGARARMVRDIYTVAGYPPEPPAKPVKPIYIQDNNGKLPPPTRPAPPEPEAPPPPPRVGYDLFEPYLALGPNQTTMNPKSRFNQGGEQR